LNPSASTRSTCSFPSFGTVPTNGFSSSRDPSRVIFALAGRTRAPRSPASDAPTTTTPAPLSFGNGKVATVIAAMPEGQWIHGDASALEPSEAWDVVLACGVFMYFPDPGYARGVIARMAAKATRAIAILDVPDVASRDDAMAFRRGSMGEAEYEAKYRGLDHLFYDRSWMKRVLIEVGATDVRIEDQQVSGYQNARFRFNAFANLP